MAKINVKKSLLKAQGLIRKGELDAAAQLFADVLENYPQNSQAAKGLESIKQARSAATRASMPSLQQQLQNLVQLFNAGNMQQVLETGQEIVAHYADEPLIHNVVGAAHASLRNYESAIDCYTRAIRLKPDYAEAHNNLGAALNEMGRHEEAVASYRSAIKFEPAFYEAYNNLGNALVDSDKYSEAISSYASAIRIKPDFAGATAKLVFQLSQICDWDALQPYSDVIESLGVSGEKVFPFDLLHIDDDPARHRMRSELYAKKTYQQRELPAIPRPDVKPERLRIGYFSADFHDHATMYLMARLFELHDHDRFDICAYSYGVSASGGMRSRLMGAVDEFYDVSHLIDSEIARLCRSHGVDIAVDLKGYTQHSRLDIFACRIAPIQISYLGYPGTTGAPFMDYMIADQVVIPQEYCEHYSESVIYLPHSYQVNDDARVISDKRISRSDAGLPENGFVFCCFNNNYKIGPREFDIWMRLLQQVEGSVLWLLRSSEQAEENLRQHAHRRGVNPGRLVFADKVNYAEHLARHRLADLFLDTFNYNAHTTASDALWVELPVVTKLGRGFAARVAGSLLGAMNLPELITNSESDYERLALELALNPGGHAKIKEKLVANRLGTPLFDTGLFTGHLESAYQQAYQRYFEGQRPESILIQS